MRKTVYEVHEGEDYIVIVDNEAHDTTDQPVASVCDLHHANEIVKALNLLEEMRDLKRHNRI